jgi:large repetitive protein
LPLGSRLGTTSNRNAGDANSLFVDPKNGELHRADFLERSCTPKVIQQVDERRKRGPVMGPIIQHNQDRPGIQFDSNTHRLAEPPPCEAVQSGACRPAGGVR